MEFKNRMLYLCPLQKNMLDACIFYTVQDVYCVWSVDANFGGIRPYKLNLYVLKILFTVPYT